MKNMMPLTEFDRQTVPCLIQLLKAALPFFNTDVQRNIAPLIRIFELKCTFDYFKKSFIPCPLNPSSPSMRCASLNAAGISELVSDENFLKYIEPYCPKDIYGLIKNFKTFSSMQEVFKSSSMSDLFKNCMNGASDITNIMSGEQQNLYEEYMKQLDNIL